MINQSYVRNDKKLNDGIRFISPLVLCYYLCHQGIFGSFTETHYFVIINMTISSSLLACNFLVWLFTTAF